MSVLCGARMPLEDFLKRKIFKTSDKISKLHLGVLSALASALYQNNHLSFILISFHFQDVLRHLHIRQYLLLYYTSV